MRIAVCRPQQPFVRGGAEIFTDKLVAELRARGHDADIVSVPFQTWPNERLLESGADVEVRRPAPRRHRAGGPRDRDEVPLVPDRASEQGRLARPPVPAGLRARPDGARPVQRDALRPGDPRADRSSRPVRARAGAEDLRDLAERGGPAAALDGPRGRGSPPPAAGARRSAATATTRSCSRSAGSTR